MDVLCLPWQRTVFSQRQAEKNLVKPLLVLSALAKPWKADWNVQTHPIIHSCKKNKEAFALHAPNVLVLCVNVLRLRELEQSSVKHSIQTGPA